MANTLDILRERLRAAGTVGIADALAYQVLSAVEEMVNARLMRVLSSKDITLTANTQIFALRTVLTSPTGIKVVSVTVANRTLIHLRDWREIFGYDQGWLGRTGTRHEVWAQMGADKLLVYPAVTTNKTATVIYAGETTTLSASGSAFDLPTEDETLVYDICEAIFHIHMRNFDEAKKKMEMIANDIAVGFPGTEKP